MEAKLEEHNGQVDEETPPLSPPTHQNPSSSQLESTGQQWPQRNSIKEIVTELKVQRKIILPLVALNFTWVARIIVTTTFLGRLGALPLAGGTLGSTISNVTGFSILYGLTGALEPICGQAFGAKNFKLLHKTLVMAIILLLLVSLPISFLWMNSDRILIRLGQEQDISMVAKTYLIYLLPDLLIYSFQCPLKTYLYSQNTTMPIMFSSVFGLIVHIPITMSLSNAKGLKGIAMAVWISDLLVLIPLALFALKSELDKWKEGGWWDQGVHNWIVLLKISGPCCITTCLEWWCYEILFLLCGHLKNAKQTLGVAAALFNFDYLLFSIMISIATCASIRISNQLGANQVPGARKSALVSLLMGTIAGIMGGLAMVMGRGIWGHLFSHDKGLILNVKKMLLIMAVLEVFNFPLSVCGGIVRGTARPQLGMYANITGFYLLALPLGVILGFKLRLGLAGLLIGFIFGSLCSFVLLFVFVLRIDWNEEGRKARLLTSSSTTTAPETDDQS